MSAGADLSQIRGDWKFHIDYLSNAITQTIKRQMKLWGELPGSAQDAEIKKAIDRQKSIWDGLRANADANGTIPTGDVMCAEFIVVCREAKPALDVWQARDDSEAVEEFAEACRQTRALCDDLEMMREQRPERA